MSLISENEQRIKNVLLIFIYAIMGLYPMTLFLTKAIRTEYLGVLFLLFLVALVLRLIKPYRDGLSKEEKYFLGAYALVFIIALLSYLSLSQAELANKRMAVYSFFVVASAIYLLFKYTRPRIELIWLAIVVGCFIALGRALLEEFKMVEELAWTEHVDRANGVMHPIRFGGLTLIMGFISLAGVLYLQGLHKSLKLIGLLGGLAGIAASFLSQSRGVWLAVPFLLVILLWPHIIRSSFRFRLWTIGILVLILIALPVIPGFDIGQRVEQAYSEIQMYSKNKAAVSSLGARMNMMEISADIISRHPIWGVGVGNYYPNAVEYYNNHKSEISVHVLELKNPHNEFLLQWVTRGTVGLLVVLVFFFVAFRYFYLNRKQNNGEYSFAAISGMVIVMASFCYGLSIALFEHRDFLIFFIIYTMFFAAAVQVEKHDAS